MNEYSAWDKAFFGGTVVSFPPQEQIQDGGETHDI